MDVPTQLELSLYYQLDRELATCFLTFYCDPYSFLNFYLFLVYIKLTYNSCKEIHIPFYKNMYMCIIIVMNILHKAMYLYAK